MSKNATNPLPKHPAAPAAALVPDHAAAEETGDGLPTKPAQSPTRFAALIFGLPFVIMIIYAIFNH